MAAAEVGELVVVRGLHIFHGFVELRVHGLCAGLEAPVFGGHFARFQLLEHLAVGAGGDVREGGKTRVLMVTVRLMPHSRQHCSLR